MTMGLAAGQQLPAGAVGINPQAIVQVESERLGGDLVYITMRDENYPGQALQAAAERMGKETGSGIRGLKVTANVFESGGRKTSMTKALFAINGLIDRKSSIFRVGPIAKAMASIPTPNQIRSFLVDFDGERPSATSLESFESNAVKVSRRIVGGSVEYSIQLASSNPDDIAVPDEQSSTLTPVKPVQAKQGFDWAILTAFLVGAIASGALVYSLLIYRPAGKRKADIYKNTK
jgi:hypothetical protein